MAGAPRPRPCAASPGNGTPAKFPEPPLCPRRSGGPGPAAPSPPAPPHGSSREKRPVLGFSSSPRPAEPPHPRAPPFAAGGSPRWSGISFAAGRQRVTAP